VDVDNKKAEVTGDMAFLQQSIHTQFNEQGNGNPSVNIMYTCMGGFGIITRVKWNNQ